MGVRAGLTEISADVYTKVKAGGNVSEADLKDRTWTSLDKTWYGFHNVFKQMAPPLKLTISGDHPHPLGAPDIDVFVEGADYDFYLGFMSPSLVKEIADSLSLLSYTEIAQLFELAGIEFDDYFQHYLDGMKQAYSQAAENGNALYICIA
jgi:hypothetical protein